MAVSIGQFVEQLAASGLMGAAEVESFQGKLGSEKRPQDAESLARELVRAGKLTKYQAQLVYQGKTKGLAFGEYVVLDKIGQGGMGIVLKAQHRKLKRQVAIKVLPAAAMKSPESVRRFYREVEAAGRLVHPNIVTAYDAGEADGTHYLAMEFVDGKDLATVVAQRGVLDVRHAVDCIVQAAKGLAAAHATGIVHRDIKPGNLLLEKTGIVKVLDMGLARVSRSFGSESEPSERLTSSGEVMGTCDYMAPEQAEDTHAADHRADIYSLGCTLYRLLTGQPLYKTDSLIKTLLAHRESPVPSLCDRRADVPAELDAIFRRMVAKRPEDRQQSMQEVIDELQGFLAGRSQPPPLPDALADGSESGALLQNLSFLQDVTPQPGGVATRHAVRARTEDTFKHHAHPHTATSISRKLLGALRPRNPVAAWFAVAVGSAALATLLGVIVITIRGRDGSKTTLHVPEGSEVSIARDGKVDVKLPDEPRLAAPPTAPPAAPDSGPPGVIPSKEPAPADTAGSDAHLNELSAEESAQGWRLLFDGKSTEGWRSQDGGHVPAGCRVDDGALRLARGQFYVFTEEDFADFDLRFDWRVSPGGDGGVVFRIARMRNVAPHDRGVQVQIKDDNTSGSALGLYDVTTSAARPVGQWNQMRILVSGSRAEHWLNGTKLAEYDIGSPEFRDRVKASVRHKDLVEFAKEASGAIALQGWTGTVWYRNIKIRALPPGGPSASPTQPAAAPAPAGRDSDEQWTDLFNGRDLTGWKPMGPQAWSASNGILKADGGGRGWLMSDEEYDDFELEVDYRLPKGGNSGIFLRAWSEGQATAGQFMEIQLMDDSASAFGNLRPEMRNASLFGMAAPKPVPDAPAEQWNTVRIRLQGRRLQETVNGFNVLDVNLDDHTAKADRVPSLSRSSGRVGLQLWDGPVEFRKVRILRLSAGAPTASQGTIRHFGYYVWDGPPELVAEIAPYTNVVIDVSWLRKGAGVIQAARKAGRPAVPVVFGRERAGVEERLFPVIQKYRPAIAAVYWADTGEVGYSRGQVNEFGRALKQKFPGMQLWVSYFNASPNVPGFEIAEEVDLVILTGLTGDSPQSVRARTDEVLAAWTQKAGSRPIVLGWLAHTGPPPGLAPKCPPGTLRAWVEAAQKHRLAGTIFASYDDGAGGGALGLRTRPDLIDEMKKCSEELGLARGR